MKISKKLSLSITFIAGLLLTLTLVMSSLEIPLFAQSKKTISPQQGLVLTSVEKLLGGQELMSGALSAQLLQKVSDGDFKAVANEQINASIYRYQPNNNELEIFLVDVEVKRDTGFQWVQLEALWNPAEEKLVDLKYQPIDYLARLNSQAASTEGLNVAQQILSRISAPDPSLMGWRYKKTDNPGQNGISNVQIVSLLPFGSYLSEGSKEPTEVAIKAQYQVSLYDYKNLVDSILYLKNYNGHWQLEDIRLLDVKRVSSP